MRRVVWALVVLAFFATGCASSGTREGSQADSSKEQQRPASGY